MKGQPFLTRLGFAWAGIRAAFRSEASFRFQVSAAAGALIVLVALRPAPLWWGLVLLTIGSVLAAELVNTALEQVVDRLHPEEDPAIRVAKDCAAAAVLVLSCASVAVLAALLVDHFRS